MNESLLARAKFILKTAGNDCVYSPKHELLPLIKELVDLAEAQKSHPAERSTAVAREKRRIVDYPR